MNCTKCNNTGWIFYTENGKEYAKKCDCVEERETIAKNKSRTAPKQLTATELEEILSELR